MRRWWAIAAGSLGALVPVLVASARPTPSVQLVGSLTIAWQGDPARGCAAQGLCGVRGSLQMLPDGTTSTSSGQPQLELFDSGAVARVTGASAGGSAGTTCADLVPVDLLFGAKYASRGGLQAVLQPGASNQPPSAGRCAGPTAADLSALALPARKLGSRGFDLSGTTTFGAGPFAVTAISTVRAVFGANGSGGFTVSGSNTATATVGRGVRPPLTHTVLEEHAELDYRIEGVAGALSTTFTGLAAPLCAPLGACGTKGALSESFGAHGVVLRFYGSRMVKHRVGSRAALADLRTGRLTLSDSFGGIPIEGTTTETVAGLGGATCSDRGTNSAFPVGSSGASRRALALSLGPQGSSSGGIGGADPLRTRCPGPSGTDVLGSSTLARATVPASALGAPRMTITFQGGGSFSASAYQGARAGSVTFSLAIVRASGGTSRVPVAPSIPPPLP